jgi:hypothetical protein
VFEFVPFDGHPPDEGVVVDMRIPNRDQGSALLDEPRCSNNVCDEGLIGDQTSIVDPVNMSCKHPVSLRADNG